MAVLDFTLPRERNNQIVQSPLSKFQISEQDQTADPQYFGNLAHDGSFYIQKWNLAAGTFRYYAGKGHTDYLTAWGNRASLPYDYFDLIF